MTSPNYRRGVEPPNKGKKYPVEVLSADEVGRLIGACGTRGASGIRNRAMIVVMWRAGLRVAECCALYPKDVDPARGTVTVLLGKGRRRRTVGLDPQAMAVVERWLDRRRRLGVPARSRLFCTIRVDNFGHPVRTAYMRELFKRLGEKAGIEKRVHPHQLRHTHAFELSLEGMPVHMIQLQLGHNSLATTERYISHIAPAQLIERIQERDWPAAA